MSIIETTALPNRTCCLRHAALLSGFLNSRHDPVGLAPFKRPKRHVRDKAEPDVPSDAVPASKSEPPLVVHAAETPRKAPVSAALKVSGDAKRKPSYAATLRVIDSVHDDGGLSTIPVHETKATVNIGGYRWRGKTGQAIDIVVSRASDHPELTLLHEVGHFIDHQALYKKGEFASEKSPLLEAWRKIVAATPTVRNLKLGAAGRRIEGEWPKKSPTTFTEALRLRELWARAYAQYVVRHGANPALQQQFEVASAHLMGLYFWLDDEFEGIDLAITTILASKSWQPPK